MIIRKRAVTVKDIHEWVASGESGSIIDVTVTPDIAKALLKYNRPGETNRLLSRRYVAAAADAIRQGKWENTGEPIIISAESLLNDGQHRLEAIIESGQSAVMDLRFGIARHAFGATNSGRKRTGSDALKLQGTANTGLTAATARLVLGYRLGLPGAFYVHIGNQDIVGAVEQYPEIEVAAQKTIQLPRGLRQSAAAAIVFCGMRTANEASVDSFLEILRTGEGKANNPPHMLRDYMFQHKIIPGTGLSGDRLKVFAAGVIAWNAWRTNSTIRTVAWREGSKFPQCEGLSL
jgi:hypothetical protein